MTRHPLCMSPAILLIVACALWGTATVLNNGLLASISPVTLPLLQLAPSVLVLWILAFMSEVKARPSLLLPLILLGILNPGIFYTMSLMGWPKNPPASRRFYGLRNC